ncbi:MAG TPA: aspartate-semialdehyde dehydrogenase [Bacillota bacterium]|nr:aspartate-semialdehyde dehydrogenase [Bacillota bacterium]
MAKKSSYNVAVVGATGAVGQKVMEILEDRKFPVAELRPLSSKRSAGKKLTFNNEEVTVQEATTDSFSNIDIAFFSAGGAITEQLSKAAVESGAVVIDNTSAFRMDKDVPLVVPEVNPEALESHKGIIANPNCSTIQMVAALNPIKEAFGLSRIVVSTYQAVSGAGWAANEELKNQTQQYLNEEEMVAEILPAGSDKKHYPIAFNALPQIDVFTENGYTAEEMKMINETKKIMSNPDLSVAATCVRLPVINSHAESIYIEVDNDDVSVKDIQDAIKGGKGVVLQDDPSTQTYPTPLSAADKYDVFVGRIREDLDNKKGFHLWVVTDNLVKGAALNTVQIAETLLEKDLK